MRWFPVRLVVATVLACGFALPVRADEAPRASFDPAVARRISPEEVQHRREAGEKPIIVDTRGSVGDVIAKGSVQVTNDRIEAWAKDVPKDALIVAYCT